VTYEPDNPLADANGMVRRPDMDLADQMVYMQLAQRGYQANVASFDKAKEAYEAILGIGK
jgi:flagellar basal-body rod protein FlgC